MRKRIQLAVLAAGILAAMLLAACSGQNASQSNIVAGRSNRDIGVNIVANYG